MTVKDSAISDDAVFPIEGIKFIPSKTPDKIPFIVELDLGKTRDLRGAYDKADRITGIIRTLDFEVPCNLLNGWDPESGHGIYRIEGEGASMLAALNLLHSEGFLAKGQYREIVRQITSNRLFSGSPEGRSR